jgi:lipoprotein-anchoring transpeptidase ErfK/SrfK
VQARALPNWLRPGRTAQCNEVDDMLYRILPHCLAPLLAVIVLTGLTAAARADVDIHIQLNSQTMRVAVDGQTVAVWPVSTARPGYHTPTGRFRPYLLERMHYSSIYEDAPMPWSMFFYGGYAIHGTYETGRLGRPVSHGCVRLSPGNARTLYGIVQRQGARNTGITITR